jgi:hypothetical protein
MAGRERLIVGHVVDPGGLAETSPLRAPTTWSYPLTFTNELDMYNTMQIQTAFLMS